MTRQPSWAYLALFATLTGVAQTKAQFVPLSLTVVDAAGGKVAEAFISIDNTSTSARTDIDGNAKLSLPPGSYGVSINAAGFLSKSAHIDLKEAKEQRIELAVAGMCSPCLTIEDPLANLRTTEVPLTALLPYAQSTSKMTPASSVTVLSASAQQRASPQLTVQVTDQSGAVIPGALVAITDSVGALKTAAYTKPDGSALFPMASGHYGISARADGFLSSRTDIDFPKANTATLALPISPLPLCGPCVNPTPIFLETTQSVITALIEP